MRSVSIPLYMLDDATIAQLIDTAQEVMLELAGERDTSELPPVIEALTAEQARRGKPITLDDLPERSDPQPH